MAKAIKTVIKLQIKAGQALARITHSGEIITEQATRSYRAGALDYLEFVLVLNRAMSIRQNYLEAINNYNQTLISIEYITGRIY